MPRLRKILFPRELDRKKFGASSAKLIGPTEAFHPMEPIAGTTLSFSHVRAYKSAMRMLYKLLIGICLTMSVPAKTPKPPIAEKKPKEIVTHGDKRIDNYFWLREKTNKQVIAYLKAENKHADEVMRGTEKFEKNLYKEILGHLKETDETAPVRHGDFYYYSRTEKGKDYAIHCRKKGLNA